MQRVLQAARFFIFLSLGPIFRAGCRILCFTHRFSRLKIEKWTFSGPPKFLKLVEETAEKLLRSDPDIIAQMTDEFTVMNAGDRLESFFEYRCGAVSDVYIAWGTDGLTTAWIFFLFGSLEYRRNRWKMADPAYAAANWREVSKRTLSWLKQHNVPAELCQCFETND